MMRRVRTKIGETLENHGITPDYVIERILKPGLEATKHTFFAGEVVDHEQRGKYADRIFKLTGLFANEPPNSGDGLERAPITINLAFLGPERAEAVLKAARESTLERDRGQPILDAEHDPHQG
jgi:hypothetical protein